jgi:hypothetical protein
MNKQNIIQGIFSLYKLHKYLKNLTYTNYTNNPYEQFAIHKTFQLYETNIINIFNMYNIENKYNTTNTIINFGILFNKHSIYRNHTILSFLHPFNIHLSELCKNNTTYTENISNNLYIKHNIDETNTINTNIIVTPLQSILLWKKCLPIENMNILILTHTNQLFKINETLDCDIKYETNGILKKYLEIMEKENNNKLEDYNPELKKIIEEYNL